MTAAVIDAAEPGLTIVPQTAVPQTAVPQTAIPQTTAAVAWRRTRRPAKTPADRSADVAMVTALLASERGAWDRFVANYARVIYAAVQRRLLPAGRGEDIEDVAQDVFLRLCKADFKLVRNYDAGRARLSTWLTVVTTSVAIDHLRKQRMSNVALDDVSEAHLAVEQPNYEKVKIPDGLLSSRQALVVELLYRRDLEVADAARLMKVDPQTVRSTHHKALTKLRRHFQGEEAWQAGL